MAALEREKAELTRFLDTSPAPPALRLHPRPSDLYREKIAALADALNQPDHKPQATELLRGLISEVRMAPEEGAPGGHRIDGRRPRRNPAAGGGGYDKAPAVGEGWWCQVGNDGCGGRI